MTSGDNTSDGDLLAELADLLGRVAGPPAAAVDAAKDLWTWRTVDAELAALGHDSLLETPTGVRAVSQPRILTFDSAELTIEVEVDETPGARRLLGQLVPGGPADLELRTGGEPITGRADDLGRFVLALPADRVRVSVRCLRHDGGDTVVETAWVMM